MKDSVIEEAFEIAREMRSHAHAPYSKFFVGAALILADDTIVGGCNVENASYGGSVCAERIAIYRAIAEKRRPEFAGIALVTESDPPVVPCALCLQVFAEFCPPDFPIYVSNTSGKRADYVFSELLGNPFGPKQLQPNG